MSEAAARCSSLATPWLATGQRDGHVAEPTANSRFGAVVEQRKDLRSPAYAAVLQRHVAAETAFDMEATLATLTTDCLFGATVIFIAAMHLVLGPAAFPGAVPVNATMDSEDRFYATRLLPTARRFCGASKTSRAKATSRSLRMTRRIDASPERVFDALVNPERMREWMFTEP